MQEAECIIVGGASGLSAAGGGDFYYSDTPSFREHFGKFADKYGFKGAFSGMMHRFFQCSQCCQDETWDAVQPVADMITVRGEGTMVPDELILRCPHCGAEMFPWVRGYGNFLQGKKYEEEYEKISKYIQKNKDRKILLIMRISIISEEKQI